MSAARRPPKPEVVIDWEPLDRALADGLEELLVQDYEELEDDRDVVAFAPDYEAYRRLERAGHLKALSVRRGGKIVGYAVFVVQPPINYKHRPWAKATAIWLAPAERKGWTGVRLIREAVKRFRAMGVQKVVIGTKANLPGAPTRDRLPALLRLLGFKKTEEVHELLL